MSEKRETEPHRAPQACGGHRKVKFAVLARNNKGLEHYVVTKALPFTHLLSLLQAGEGGSTLKEYYFIR